MVDMLFVCDLLYFVRSKYYGVYIIVVNDDDVIFVIFIVEVW